MSTSMPGQKRRTAGHDRPVDRQPDVGDGAVKFRQQHDGLALEYQREYGSARGNLDVSNFVNNPAASGKCRVFGGRLTKEAFDLGRGDAGAFDEDASDPFLVRED
eukprot:Opistho-1_new@73877